MSNNTVTLTTPVGRLVSGDPYTPNTTDAQGNPLVIKTGPNKGQPREEYAIGLAIPKGSEQSWKETPWGQTIMGVIRQSWPNIIDPNTNDVIEGYQFAFKITDGDSQTPNKKGKKPCDNEHYRGHWVMWWSNGFAPKCCNHDGSQYLAEPIIKRGHYIQVNGTVTSNNNNDNPGIYLNVSLIAHSAYGEEIVSGPDASEVGFGGAPLPQGASQTPVGGMATEQAATPPPVQQQAATPPPVQQQAATPPPVEPATDLVTPPPVPPAEPKFTYQGQTKTKAEWLAAGWNEAQINQHCTPA